MGVLDQLNRPKHLKDLAVELLADPTMLLAVATRTKAKISNTSTTSKEVNLERAMI